MSLIMDPIYVPTHPTQPADVVVDADVTIKYVKRLYKCVNAEFWKPVVLNRRRTRLINQTRARQRKLKARLMLELLTQVIEQLTMNEDESNDAASPAPGESDSSSGESDN